MTHDPQCIFTSPIHPLLGCWMCDMIAAIQFYLKYGAWLEQRSQAAKGVNTEERNMPSVTNVTVPITIEYRVALTDDDGVTIRHPELSSDERALLETVFAAALEHVRDQ